MYDKQFWYWPEKNISLVLTLYLNGDSLIECEGMTDVECVALLEEAYESGNDVDDYLDIKGLVLLDHLPLL